MARKINKTYIQRLVEEVIKEERTRSSRKKLTEASNKRLHAVMAKARLILEGDDSDVPAEVETADTPETPAPEATNDPAAGAAGVSGMSADSDINVIGGQKLTDAMFSGVENDLYKAIQNATGWASGALGKSGIDVADPTSWKAAAVKIFGNGDEEKARAFFKTNVDNVNKKIGASEGFAKPEMPALEGKDIAAVADALTPGGKLNIDSGADFKDGKEGFEEWFSANPQSGDAEYPVGDKAPAEEESEEKPKEVVADSVNRSKDNLIMERWGRLAGLYPLTEINSDPKFPFAGAAKVMDGAPNIGKDGTINVDAIEGKARAFLTKGHGTEGDSFSVSQGQSLGNGEMKPTQTNIKAGKSILFALANSGIDMEGGFVTDTGEILDGHHRWSGQHIRTGGDVQHSNVNAISKGGMDIKQFLTMLTVLGNALGRPTKLK